MHKPDLNQLPDRVLLLNVYLTQVLLLVAGLIWIHCENVSPSALFQAPANYRFITFGVSLAILALVAQAAVSYLVPQEVLDDGGLNEKLFRRRTVWQILLLCIVIACCEEIMFRAGMQQTFGNYWTSVLFAAVHVRYLKHWLPTAFVFAMSYSLGFIYVATGTLYAPILAHFVIDVVLALYIRFGKN